MNNQAGENGAVSDRGRKLYVAAGLTIASMAVLFASWLWALEGPKPRDDRVAALALPTGAAADWQQWDSFLTNSIKKIAQQLRPEQQEQVSEVFLDARYQLVQTINSGISDPVPQLFSDTWGRLSPILKQAVPGLSQQSANQVTGFATAMDGIKSLADLGTQLGFFRITPDALRGAARLLGTGDVDPLAYTENIDSTCGICLASALRCRSQSPQSPWSRGDCSSSGRRRQLPSNR